MLSKELLNVITMKKVLLVLFVIAAPFLAQAQQIPFMVEEGKVWHMAELRLYADVVPDELALQDFPSGRECRAFPFDLEIKGDTIVNGKLYKKLTEDNQFRFCLRQEGSRIYTIGGNFQYESLWYDFSLNPGDTITCGRCQPVMQVMQVDTIIVDGTARRRLAMGSYSDNKMIFERFGIYGGPTLDIWVEGIGSVHGPLSPYEYCFIIGNNVRLLDCYQDGQQLIDFDTMASDVPLNVYFSTPVSVRPVSKSSSAPTHSVIYDQQGRRLMQQPRKGVYIRDGRKVVVNR
jgi:hypothetical protein